MTDKELILNQLDKYYDVGIWLDDFGVIEIDSGKHRYKNEFLSSVFDKLFGLFTTDDGNNPHYYFTQWYDAKVSVLEFELIQYLDSYDGERSFSVLDTEIQLDLAGNYTPRFLKNKFRKHYEHKFFEPKLESYLKSLDISKGSIVLSNNLAFEITEYGDFTKTVKTRFLGYYLRTYSLVIKEYTDKLDKSTTYQEALDMFSWNLNLQTEEVIKHVIPIIKSWYYINVMDDKLARIFSEFVLTPITNGWRVTWIGHGRLTIDKLLIQFKADDTKYHKDYIIARYDDWYSDAVVSASSKLQTLSDNIWINQI